MAGFLIYYIKKSDALKLFKRTRTLATMLNVAVLLAMIYMTWSLGLGLVQTYFRLPDSHTEIPFLIAHYELLAAILTAVNICLIWFAVFSKLPENMFKKRLSKFEVSGESELIDAVEVIGAVQMLFGCSLMGVTLSSALFMIWLFQSIRVL